MKHIVLGILAHVDAGKTTLSENLLYLCGNIRSMGRVDKRDTFLDDHSIERDRGITIFSKQARLTTPQLQMDLLDTPGHVDFGAEMERTLSVLDYAILMISAADGVEAHTLTLWKLLQRYEIPTFIFVNKMDQQGANVTALISEIQKKLSRRAVDFSDYVETIRATLDEAGTSKDLAEAMPESMSELLMEGDDTFLEEFFAGERSTVSIAETAELVKKRTLYPVLWGSALKGEGIRELLSVLETFTTTLEYGHEMGAVVYKITRDGNTRLTHVKVTGGSLKVRTSLENYGKITQIRCYSGNKFETLDEAMAGRICTLVGVEHLECGDTLGVAKALLPVMEPVLTYQVILPEEVNPMLMLPKLKELEEEIPELNFQWQEETKEILVSLMGAVQTEVLITLVEERFGVKLRFGQGRILYKETIDNVVEGVGHFEPLRHYAEVHVLIEAGARGSGIELATACREEDLAKNWQRLILTHLQEKIHRGVLTRSPLTDVKITLVNGRAHNKHTEGGDFRQATYRAVRQGLMQAQNVLLEPYYAYELVLPSECVGRAMSDLEKMHAIMEGGPVMNPDETVTLCGTAAVSVLQGYSEVVKAYSKGRGRLRCTFYGYDRCQNTEEVVASRAYQPETDLANSPDSVFCANGAGFVVPWYEVPSYMHVESYYSDGPHTHEERLSVAAQEAQRRGEEHSQKLASMDLAMGYEEVDAILHTATHANTHKASNQWKHGKGNATAAVIRTYETKADYEKAHQKAMAVKKAPYLLVDGYNVIFAWPELSVLAKDNIDAARGRLMDILCNYQAMIGRELIVVFDAYRRFSHPTEFSDYHNIHVVFTKTAQTADHYIEQFTHEHHAQYDIMVATSDGVEQVIVRGQGAQLMSSRDLIADIGRRESDLKDYLGKL